MRQQVRRRLARHPAQKLNRLVAMPPDQIGSGFSNPSSIDWMHLL